VNASANSVTSKRFDNFDLGKGYTIRQMTFEAYRNERSRLKPQFQPNPCGFSSHSFLTERSRQWVRRVDDHAYRLCLGIYFGALLCGLHYSQQEAANIVMRETGLLRDHRGRGVYTALLKELIHEFQTLGFKSLSSG
jgi:L-amino acid N-acyltransferase YncA